jgi:hypothetical protein
MNCAGNASNAQCPYCGLFPMHSPEQCSMVAAIEYYPTGAIKRVEKRNPWPQLPEQGATWSAQK